MRPPSARSVTRRARRAALFSLARGRPAPLPSVAGGCPALLDGFAEPIAMPFDDPTYVFTLERVEKIYDDTVVLKGITLAFLPGAKIGLIGSNGAGKSTLL